MGLQSKPIVSLAEIRNEGRVKWALIWNPTAWHFVRRRLMTDQEELTNEMIRMFYEKPEFGNCSQCGRYDKLVRNEDYCYLCQEAFDEEDRDETE